MKILNVFQTRDLDDYTIAHEPISSVDLMERASKAFTGAFTTKFDKKQKVHIFCGLGNNGGDGLAIARLLIQENYQVEVHVLRFSDKNAPDFAINYRRLKEWLEPREIREITDFPTIPQEAIIIDAMFGSGLSRPLEGLPAEIVSAINELPNTKVAVDIASGLYADTPFEEDQIILEVDHTISFQMPKLAFMLPQNSPYVGQWEVVPIELHEDYIQSAKTSYYSLEASYIKRLLRKRQKFDHKGSFGHALMLLGSHGKMGAAVLAARACMHSGVGLLTVHIPQCGYQIMQVAVPEAMVTTDFSDKFITQLPEFPEKKYQAIGIGCGIDQYTPTLNLLEQLINYAENPLVLDADALNLLGANPWLLERLPPESILTPHPKEFERISRKAANDYERLEILQNFCQSYQVHVVLKGAHTAMASPDEMIYFNTTGNPGMATAGSGDVLTGIITSLLAQGYAPRDAAHLGVYLHGLAGDFALEQESPESLTASDLIENLGKAFKQIMVN